LDEKWSEKTAISLNSVVAQIYPIFNLKVGRNRAIIAQIILEGFRMSNK
jgi:hypothetical protein